MGEEESNLNSCPNFAQTSWYITTLCCIHVNRKIDFAYNFEYSADTIIIPVTNLTYRALNFFPSWKEALLMQILFILVRHLLCVTDTWRC